MLLAELILLIIAIVMFGPALTAAIGSFFTWLIFIVLAALSFPLQVLLNWKDNKEMNRLIEEMDEAEAKGDKFRYLTLQERYAIAAERSHKKTSMIIWTIATICLVLFSIKLAIII